MAMTEYEYDLTEVAKMIKMIILHICHAFLIGHGLLCKLASVKTG